MLDKMLRDPNDEDLELEDEDNDDLTEEDRRLRKRESERWVEVLVGTEVFTTKL